MAIPSYKRSETIGKKTLRTLKEEGFLASDIDIFVANEQEFEEYERAVDKSLYDNLIIGVPTLIGQRIFINNFYPKGMFIIQMDDDIRGFKKIKECHLPNIFRTAFDFCIKNNIPMWGVYPCDNGRFMKNHWTLGLFNCCGICFGLIDRTIEPLMDVKEDWSRSLQCYKQYKKLLRLDFVAPKTTYWSGAGGMNFYRTVEMEQAAADKLLELFSEYVQKVIIKKNGQPDIKLKRIQRTLYETLP